jgi:hypothetical protein
MRRAKLPKAGRAQLMCTCVHTDVVCGTFASCSRLILGVTQMICHSKGKGLYSLLQQGLRRCGVVTGENTLPC